MVFNQNEFDIRCEWGAQGVAQLAPISDVVVIVDVLSFSTCVDIATGHGAQVFPFRLNDERVRAFAESVGAIPAGSKRSTGKYTLSPQSLEAIPRGTRLVLPSPNGATLTLATGDTPTLCGCLRNARAVAHAATRIGKRIAIIPAGERWSDGTLRPAVEDWLGAGAILNELAGKLSPEARAARASFRELNTEFKTTLEQCSSGKELIAQGFARDVELAAEWNVSNVAPYFRNGAYGA